MADLSRTAPKGTVDNVLLNINKFVFPGDVMRVKILRF